MIDAEAKLTEIKEQHKKIAEAKKVGCTCSGFILQYEGGCQCGSKYKVELEKEKLLNLVRDLYML